ncbi:MAG: hypothetical protein BGP25_06820 [Lysobacterales bacterium 63-13]|nr:MAG: hypothetical protein BGP25_06820 [Xanthomonadales bacterium 63-13]
MMPVQARIMAGRDAADAASGIVLVMRVHLDIRQRGQRPHQQGRVAGFNARRVSTRAGQPASRKGIPNTRPFARPCCTA